MSLTEPIKLHCLGCKRTVDYPRDIDTSIPENVVRIEAANCDQCDQGDFGLETWLDVHGKEVDQC